MIKVTLRQKPITGHRQALYLDFYPPITDPETGQKTRRQFLNMYLHDEVEHMEEHYTDDNGKPQRRFVQVQDKKGRPKAAKLTFIEKQHNKETRQIAEQIRQRRDNEVNKPEVYTAYEQQRLKQQTKGQRSFVEYFKALTDKRKASNHDNWVSAYNYLERFTGGQLTFAEVDEAFCNEFKEYLLTSPSSKSTDKPISQNSAVSYFNKFKAALSQAFKDGYLSEDLNSRVDAIKPTETQRFFLSLEELNKLAQTPCQDEMLKRAALFSALTGLRFSDIQKLAWHEVEHSKAEGYTLHFRQKKTQGVEVLPISDQAFELLGQRGKPHEAVFPGLTYSAYGNRHLYQWIGAAGITKNITFHCFRHTFATLQISAGTDIYTVSKMLGHRELKTTQIYAKVIDQAKREAANRISLNL
ncbi:MAG: site-specific integrase [Bacteroidetes bacterium]|nr:site-specific integrase [Bacteroidota bacterium]